MGNKDNYTPGTGDDLDKPNKGMGRPEDLDRDRNKDRDLEEDTRSKEQGRKPGSGNFGSDR